MRCDAMRCCRTFQTTQRVSSIPLHPAWVGGGLGRDGAAGTVFQSMMDYSRRDGRRNESAMGRMTMPCVALARTMTHQWKKKKFRKYS